MALVSPPIPLALDVFARSLAEIGRAGELDLANIAGIVGYGSPYAFAMRHLPWRHPETPTNLLALAGGGAIGYLGNWIAAQIRTRAGRSLDSPALLADGNHARADAYVSLAVIASAVVVALGMPVADPLIGLGITGVILKITWDSWRTVRGQHFPLAGTIPRSHRGGPTSQSAQTRWARSSSAS